MCQRILVATRKGLFTVKREAQGVVDRSARLPRRQRFDRPCRSPRRHCLRRARPRPLRREIASATVPAERGRRSRLPPIRPSPKTQTTPTCGASRSRGLRCVSGSWVTAERTSPACCGAGRSPAACSARPTAAARGRSVARFGTIRDARSGSAAAPICRACTRSASIRAMRRQVRVGVSCGGVWTTRNAGETWACTSRGHARRVHAARAAVQARASRTRTASCSARAHPTTSGRSTTTASSARPRRGRVVARGRRTCRAVAPSASPSPCIRKDPDDGLVRPGRQRREAHPVDGQGRGDAHARRRRDIRRCCAMACRRSTPTTSTFRHCLDVDGSGERLAFGTTTGRTMGDRGPGRHLAGRQPDLPPIYCVRFAP